MEGFVLIPKRYRFEVWWVMEESFEKEVKRLWRSINNDIFVKPECVKMGLGRWARLIGQKNEGIKRYLTKKLSKLSKMDRDYGNLVDLIDTKIQLNLEVDKDEIY